MNWLINILEKEARKRRFTDGDRIRYWTEGRKGKGKGIVLTPNFAKGTVRGFNSETRKYIVEDESNESSEMHPRNLMPETIKSQPISTPPYIEPAAVEVMSEPVMTMM